MIYGEVSASERRFLPPAVAVSVVAFALRPPEDAVLGSSAGEGTALWLPLVRRTREPFLGCWALPGGPTRWDETLAGTALRTTRWAVRRSPSYLEQLYSFGGVERSAEAQRLVTIAYWALYAEEILSSAAEPEEPSAPVASEDPSASAAGGTGRGIGRGGAAVAGIRSGSGRWDDPVDPLAGAELHAGAPGQGAEPGDDRNVAWFSADALPRLAFDHAVIVDTALARLRTRTEYSAVAHHFLGSSFTLARLRSVHEAIRGGAVDPANFRRQALARGDLVETGELESGARNRPARLYRFKEGPKPGALDTPDPLLTRSTP